MPKRGSPTVGVLVTLTRLVISDSMTTAASAPHCWKAARCPLATCSAASVSSALALRTQHSHVLHRPARTRGDRVIGTARPTRTRNKPSDRTN